MNTIIITSIVLFLIISFNIFVYILWRKINKLEINIIEIFKKRNNQIITIYWITKNILVRHEDIFETFFILKRKDFWEDSYNIELKDKLSWYKKMHNEVNFIIKVCEKHKEVLDNPRYIYIKESILEKSSEIWNNIEIYENILKKHKLLSKISKITIIWLLIN